MGTKLQLLYRSYSIAGSILRRTQHKSHMPASTFEDPLAGSRLIQNLSSFMESSPCGARSLEGLDSHIGYRTIEQQLFDQ
jgi:hypothetical protein